MPQPDRAWWDDVQYLREPLERKREKEARRGLRLDARAAARAVAERHAAPVAEPSWTSIHGLDSVHELDAMPRSRRFERSAPEDAPRARRVRALAPSPSPRPPRARRFERPSPSRATRRAASLRALAPSAVACRARRRARRGRRAVRAADQARRPRARGTRPLPAPSRRRTVEITGRTVGAPSLPRLVQIDRRRPARRAAERVGARPDRLALWAVVLGFFLIFVAVTSTSHAATRAHSAGAASGRVVHQQVFRAHTAALRAIPPAR